jgi:hypothetical protein
VIVLSIERKNVHKAEKNEGLTKKNKKLAEDLMFPMKSEPNHEPPLYGHPPQPEEQKIYCSCQQQLEGEMIECENPDVMLGLLSV